MEVADYLRGKLSENKQTFHSIISMKLSAIKMNTNWKTFSPPFFSSSSVLRKNFFFIYLFCGHGTFLEGKQQPPMFVESQEADNF